VTAQRVMMTMLMMTMMMNPPTDDWRRRPSPEVAVLTKNL
jgi:hypothetical protein